MVLEEAGAWRGDVTGPESLAELGFEPRQTGTMAITLLILSEPHRLPLYGHTGVT